MFFRIGSLKNDRNPRSMGKKWLEYLIEYGYGISKVVLSCRLDNNAFLQYFLKSTPRNPLMGATTSHEKNIKESNMPIVTTKRLEISGIYWV